MPRFPYLKSLAQEIDKLGFDIETEAKDIVEKEVAAVREKKTQVFDKARTALNEHREAIHSVSQDLDKVSDALGDNSSLPKSKP